MFVDAGNETSDADELGAIIADGTVFGELDLPEDHDGADGKDHGHRKLDDDECFRGTDASRPALKAPFNTVTGLKEER